MVDGYVDAQVNEQSWRKIGGKAREVKDRE
jgi:hypothetical protein